MWVWAWVVEETLFFSRVFSLSLSLSIYLSLVGFKKSAESGTTQLSRIYLDVGRNEFDTRYNLYLDSTLNRLDSGNSINILS